MRNIISVLVSVLVVVGLTVGCSKTSATGPSSFAQATATSTAVVSTATTVVVGSPVVGTSTATATVTSTSTGTPVVVATTAPTIVPTATPLTQLFVRVLIVDAGPNTSVAGVANNVNVTCGGYAITGASMQMPYDSAFTAMSDVGVTINGATSVPGTPIRVIVMISKVQADLYDPTSTAYMFPFINSAADVIATEYLPFSYDF